MIQDEAVKLKAKLGPGETRQQQQDALGGAAPPSRPSRGRPKR